MGSDTWGPGALGPDSRIGRLILLRHGRSEWNARNVFTGWADVPLSAQGREEAVRAGGLFAEYGLRPDAVHTSLLRRTIATADLALGAADRAWIPVYRTWRLNGRHYGALQGRGKAQVRREFGAEQFALWRRSYDVRPPARTPDQPPDSADARYAGLPPELIPRTECLKDVAARLLPYWYDALVPQLRQGATVLVVSHGNTLRSFIKHLDRIADDAIAAVDVPTGIPLVYGFDESLCVLDPGGRYLDPRGAAAAVDEIRRQGT